MATPERVLTNGKPPGAQNKKRELAEFLKAKRARIEPGEVGLPTSARRRTTGLRREDVAELAGISAIWYTWLEQAREINVSDEILGAIAAALRLTADEKKHLFALADKFYAPAKSAKTTPIPTTLRIALDGFTAIPAFVMGRYLDVLAWNKTAETVFGEFLTDAGGDKNWVKFVFNKDNRRFFAKWEDFARCTTAVLRRDYGCYLEVDPRGSRLLGELAREFPEFDVFWREHDVLDKPHSRKEFCHPQAGLLIFDSVTLTIEDAADFRLVIYAPTADSDTEIKMQNLVK